MSRKDIWGPAWGLVKAHQRFNDLSRYYVSTVALKIVDPSADVLAQACGFNESVVLTLHGERAPFRVAGHPYFPCIPVSCFRVKKVGLIVLVVMRDGLITIPEHDRLNPSEVPFVDHLGERRRRAPRECEFAAATFPAQEPDDAQLRLLVPRDTHKKP